MHKNNAIIRIFMMPLQFPCGPQSSCCGPIGQSEEEVSAIKTRIEKELKCNVEIINVTNGKDMRNHPVILRFIRTFGPSCLPVITVGDDIVSVGTLTPDDAVNLLKDKINNTEGSNANL